MQEKRLKIFSADFFNKNRSILFLILVLLVGLFSKNYFSAYNIKSVLNSSALYAFIGLAFTFCLIAGHMDLSVGYMATTGAIVVLGMKTLNGLPWLVSFLIALCVGAVVGFINGILVSKGHIHSFIATLGMQFVLKGGMNIYCNGAEISVKGDFALTDSLNSLPIAGIPFSYLFLCTLLIVVLYSIMLNYTRFGRNVFMIGGNIETAWLAGIKSDRVTIATFVLSSMTCAMGGALFGIAQGTATPTLGEKGIAPLMVALTATIIGGTSIYGGKGSVAKTYISILAIVAMFSALTNIFGKFEYQIFFMGFALVVSVVYETLNNYFREKRIGIRPNLALKYHDETGKNLKTN